MSSNIIYYEFCGVVLLYNLIICSGPFWIPNVRWSKHKQAHTHAAVLKIKEANMDKLTSHLRLESANLSIRPKASTLENDAQALLGFMLFCNIHENSKSSQMCQNELNALILDISTV